MQGQDKLPAPPPDPGAPVSSWTQHDLVMTVLCRDTDKVTEWNKTLTEARVLKRINNDVAISYQVESIMERFCVTTSPCSQ